MTAEELLSLDVETVLHRLFWDEPLARMVPTTGSSVPRFSCTCSKERVSSMLRNLGADEIESVIAEQGSVSVGCEFCGAQYVFDPIDAAALFMPNAHDSSGSSGQPN
jgi:molecular chaperone Hsp33